MLITHIIFVVYFFGCICDNFLLVLKASRQNGFTRYEYFNDIHMYVYVYTIHVRHVRKYIIFYGKNRVFMYVMRQQNVMLDIRRICQQNAETKWIQTAGKLVHQNKSMCAYMFVWNANASPAVAAGSPKAQLQNDMKCYAGDSQLSWPANGTV